MKGQVPSDISAGFDLGFATLTLDAAVNGSTYSAGLTVDPGKFALSLPRLVAVTDAGILGLRLTHDDPAEESARAGPPGLAGVSARPRPS